jgi:EmrB/QacA subfamily drug resistance transporter
MGDSVHIENGPAGSGKWLVFCLVATGVFMSTLDSSIVNTALPVLMKSFSVSMTVIEWVPLVYLLTVSSLLLTFGRLSDMHGKRPVYCFGFLVFSAGSLFCALAPSAFGLIAARAFQGVGASMIMACSPALVVDAFPQAERGKALGMVGTVVAAGLTTGPALGGLILAHLSWPVIFYINIPIGITAAAVATGVLKKIPARRLNESMDHAGAVLLAVCLTAFLLILTRCGDWGIASSRSLAILALFGLSAGLLVRVETRTAFPILDPGLLKIRLFSLPVLSAVILFVSLFVVTFLMPFYLVHPMGLPMDRVGGILMIPFFFLFFVSPAAGAMSDRVGSRWLCTLAMALLALSLVLLSRLPPVTSIWDIAWRLSLTGIAIGIFISPNSSAAMSAVAPHRRGIASGAVATARNLGMVIGVALAGQVFNTVFSRVSGGAGLKVYSREMAPFFMQAFETTMLVAAGVAAAGIVVAFSRGKEVIDD